MKTATRSLHGIDFIVPEPADYPYGGNTFEDEIDIKNKHWANLGGKVVFDVGAAWGGYTLPALAQGAYAVAFEPTRQGCAVLDAAIRLNGWEGQADVLRAALFSGEELPEWILREVHGVRYPVGGPMEVWTLDDVMRSSLDHVNKVDLIKIDVEGAELGVIQGAKSTLNAYKPKLLIEDHAGIYPDCTTESSTRPLCALLENLGYTVTIERFGDELGGRNFIVAEHP
jgi:FkbM family methyltransferase